MLLFRHIYTFLRCKCSHIYYYKHIIVINLRIVNVILNLFITGENMVGAIKKLCSLNNMSISDLERSLMFSSKTVYAWDKHRPSVDKAKAVADYFGVSVDYLLKPEFVELLSDLMRFNSMSVSKLADLAGILPSRLDELLDGAEPDQTEINAISNVLEVDPTYFSDIQLKENQESIRDAEIEICQIVKGMSDEKLHIALTVVRALAAE